MRCHFLLAGKCFQDLRLIFSAERASGEAEESGRQQRRHRGNANGEAEDGRGSGKGQGGRDEDQQIGGVQQHAQGGEGQAREIPRGALQSERGQRTVDESDKCKTGSGI